MSHPVATPDKKTLWKVISASSAGTLIEWYDFFVYGALATIIAGHFFPKDNPTLALLSTLAIYVAEHTPQKHRGFYTSFIQITATGGLTPLIATWMVGRTGNPYAGLAYSIAIALATTVIGAIYLKESRHAELE